MTPRSHPGETWAHSQAIFAAIEFTRCDLTALLWVNHTNRSAPIASSWQVPLCPDTLRHAALAQHRVAAVRGPDGKQALWPWLLAGRWSVVDEFSAQGMRYVIARKNPDDDVVHRALPERARSVVEFVRAGRSGKWIAIELRLSESTVARTLHMALRRIGVTDTTALIGMKNALFEPLDELAAGIDLAIARLDPPGAFATPLSAAERAIVTGILGGKRVAAIARERGTSPRTVSNQIANVYRKLGVSSRREVLALLT